MRTLVLIFTLSMIIPTINAQESLPQFVKVSGEGIVKVIPDGAIVTVRVENKGDAAQQVKAENDKTIAAVIAHCKSVGIAEKDVQTQYVNLNKNYDYNKKTYNYTANQTISLKIRKLDDFDTVMSGLLSSGINRIDGVQFTSSQMDRLESDARKKAVTNAKKKAEEYAGVLQQKVGRAIQINEQQQVNTPMPYASNRMMMKAETSMDSSQGPTIAPGELTISCTIHITFALE